MSELRVSQLAIEVLRNIPATPSGNLRLSQLAIEVLRSIATATYSMTGLPGDVVLTGHSATLQYNSSGGGMSYPMTASGGAFNVTGYLLTFQDNRHMSANAGTYTLVGEPAALQPKLPLTVATGSFTETGHASAFTRHYGMIGTTGTISVVGKPALLLNAFDFPVTHGTFVETGHIVVMDYGQLIHGPPGAYVITGSHAGLVNGKAFPLGTSGAFTLSGGTAKLAHNYHFQTTQGSYFFVGFATLSRQYVVDLRVSYALSGSALMLTRQYPGAELSGSFVTSPHSAALKYGHRMMADPYNYVLCGKAITSGIGFAGLPAATGSYALEGSVAGIARSYGLFGISGQFDTYFADAFLVYSGGIVYGDIRWFVEPLDEAAFYFEEG